MKKHDMLIFANIRESLCGDSKSRLLVDSCNNIAFKKPYLTPEKMWRDLDLKKADKQITLVYRKSQLKMRPFDYNFSITKKYHNSRTLNLAYSAPLPFWVATRQ